MVFTGHLHFFPGHVAVNGLDMYLLPLSVISAGRVYPARYRHLFGVGRFTAPAGAAGSGSLRRRRIRDSTSSYVLVVDTVHEERSSPGAIVDYARL